MLNCSKGIAFPTRRKSIVGHSERLFFEKLSKIMVFRKRRLPGPEKLRELVLKDFLTGGEIADRYDVNRSFVYAELRRFKIPIKKAINIAVVCSYLKCRKQFTVQRHKIRKLKKKKIYNVYCSPNCYYSSRRTRYKPRKRSTYSSRRIVSKYVTFPLTSKMVVHHINNNNQDLSLKNLELYKSQSQHATLHHRIMINKTRPKSKQLKLPEPIWKGSDVGDWE